MALWLDPSDRLELAESVESADLVVDDSSTQRGKEPPVRGLTRLLTLTFSPCLFRSLADSLVQAALAVSVEWAAWAASAVWAV